MEAKYTCITCRVAFKDPDTQRQHYKTDWHRYNLKRKVAELPAVTAEEFQRRVLLQREKDNKEAESTATYCSACKKTFTTQNSYNNHLNSKKHRIFVEQHGQVPFPADNAYSQVHKKVTPESDESDIEEIDSDEWEADSGGYTISINNCLFCDHHSASMLKNLRHMTVAHSFFVPDVEYVVDMRGLLLYLSEKVFQYYICLWCNDRGRTFHSMNAAQQHMIDKGHCKMLHEKEAVLEYADFYDYSSSYPDHGEKVDPEEEVTVCVLDDSEYELVLPSGAKIGHRSLMRYYRQNLDPNKSIVPHQKKIHRVMAQYKALGWTETTREQAARKERDIRYMRRAQAKYSVVLGTRANKLQKHFRHQVFF